MRNKISKNFNLHKFQYTFWIFLGLIFIILGLETTIQFWGLIYSGFWYITACCGFIGLCGVTIIIDTLHDMGENK